MPKTGENSEEILNQNIKNKWKTEKSVKKLLLKAKNGQPMAFSCRKT